MATVNTMRNTLQKFINIWLMLTNLAQGLEVKTSEVLSIAVLKMFCIRLNLISRIAPKM